MAETVSVPILVTPTTHERLTAIKDAHDLASFDRLIMRALDAWESRGCDKPGNAQPSRTSQDAAGSP
jgi:hypothetical protein